MGENYVREQIVYVDVQRGFATGLRSVSVIILWNDDPNANLIIQWGHVCHGWIMSVITVKCSFFWLELNHTPLRTCYRYYLNHLDLSVKYQSSVGSCCSFPAPLTNE